MEFDVSIISTNEYLPEEIVRQDIPEKYVYDDEGELCYAFTTVSSEKTLFQLINFLFPGFEVGTEVYRSNYAYVLDLSSARTSLVDFDYLEQNYSKWLGKTGRKNQMYEYGILIDFIGFAKRGLNRKCS